MAHGDVAAWREHRSRLAERATACDADADDLLALGIAEWVLLRDESAATTLYGAFMAGADQATACFHLALASDRAGEAESAELALACARDAAPEDPFVLFLAGSRAAAAGDFEAARADLIVADALAPPRLVQRTLRARIDLLLACACGDAEGRRALGERYVEGQDGAAEAWLIHARLLSLHAPTDALDALQRARAVAETPALWVEIADAHLAFGDAASAQALLENAAEAAPEWAVPHARLGDYWSERSRWGWALDAWRRAVQRDRTLQGEIVGAIAEADPVLAERFLSSLDGN